MSDDELRARRRAAAREHHPDVGGDPDAFVRAMAALDRPGGASLSEPGGRGDIVVVTSTRSRITRTITSTSTNLADRLRRRVPWTRRNRFGHL